MKFLGERTTSQPSLRPVVIAALGKSGVTAPKTPTRDAIYDNPRLASLPSSQRKEVAKTTLELYEVARDRVAPVIAGFADYLLREAHGSQIVFSARDGLGSLKAARVLKGKFDYNNSDPDQLVYGYLTRRVVSGSTTDTIATHLKQAGVRDLDNTILLADIGMYGSVLPTVRKVLPNVEPHYLISKSTGIKGYASNPDNTLSTFTSISGNPAVHFMEDTFSGPIASPTRLVDTKGHLIPNTASPTYPPAEAIKRRYALAAITDYTRTLVEPPQQPATDAINEWNTFLADQDNYAHLMVPHEY